MHVDGLGDVLQDHRLHGLLAAVEECLLALDDRPRHPEHRVVPDLEAAQEPACLLKLGAQHRMVGRARDHAGIALVHADSRQCRGIQLDEPPLRSPSREDIRHDVFSAQRLERRTRPRVAAAHQREGDIELLAADVQLALQRRKLVAGHQLQVPVGEGARNGEAGQRRVELRELQLDALGDRACANARRIELLDDGEHALDTGRVRRRLDLDRFGNCLGGFRQVAVVVDRVDDCAADCEGLGRQVGEFELPGEVVAERSPRFVGQLHVAIGRTRPRRFGFRRIRFDPVVADLDDRFGLVFFRGTGGRLVRGRVEGPGRLEVLVGFEHHVAFERLQHLLLQLDRRQLKQANGLLQLRRHRQLLTDPELKAGLHHAE